MVCFENTILDLNLSIYEKMVYIVLCAHAKKDGVAFPSVNTIAREASCSRAKVFEALKTLEEQGAIVRDPRIYEGRGQSSSQYEIVDIVPRPQNIPGGDCDSPPSQTGDAPKIAGSTTQTGESATWTEGSTTQTGGSTTWTGGVHDVDGGVHHVDAVEQDIYNKKIFNKTQEQKNTPPTPPNGEQQTTAEQSQRERGKERKQPFEESLENLRSEEIRRAYNTILPELPQAGILTASRTKTLNQRMTENAARMEIDWWKRYFLRVREFPWPMGENPNNWRADFDWLIGEKGMQKILEGGFGRSTAVAERDREEANWALQRKYTDEHGVVDARALLRELYGD
jgi:hypothetical protein